MKNPKISQALLKYYTNHSPINKQRIHKRCQYCGKTFDVSPAFKNQKYCSRKCFGLSEKGNIPWNKSLDKTDPRVAQNIKNWVAPLKGKHQTIEAINKIREYQILHPNKITSNTSIEKKIEVSLIDMGMKINSDFFAQFSIPTVCISDFYIPSKNILIFTDGDYWHANPKKYKSRNFIKRKNKFAKDIWEHDAKITKSCKKLGYKVIRLWETDINTNIENCIDRIFNS